MDEEKVDAWNNTVDVRVVESQSRFASIVPKSGPSWPLKTQITATQHDWSGSTEQSFSTVAVKTTGFAQ